MKKSQKKQLLLITFGIGLVYYFFVLLPEEENKKKKQSRSDLPETNNKSEEELKVELEDDAWEKGRIWDLPINSWADREVKKMSNILVRKYQEDALIFPDGDRDERFYFSRSATYTIHFPPALYENYEKAQETGIDCSLLIKTEELILSDKINSWVDKVKVDPVRGQPGSDKKDNSALFYGAPGTGKTRTMMNICVEANRYPLIEVKGSALTPSKEDQDSGLLPLKKFCYTISELEWVLVKECGLEREENGEVRYILFVDEADQISNNALTHDPNKLRFLKDCLEGIDADSRSSNLWVFATNHLKDIEEAVYREGRLSNPLDFSWNWNEFKKYCQQYNIFGELPERWQKTDQLSPEDNLWVRKFNKTSFQKEFLGNDPDHPSRKKFWHLFITNNPDACYTPERKNKEKESNDNDDEKEVEIEIGKFLEYFWGLYGSGDLMHYKGKFESFQKTTIEKVLDTHLTNIVNKIEEKMDDVLDELETSRIEGRKEITDSVQKIFEILAKR